MVENIEMYLVYTLVIIERCQGKYSRDCFVKVVVLKPEQGPTLRNQNGTIFQRVQPAACNTLGILRCYRVFFVCKDDIYRSTCTKFYPM